MTLDGEDQLQKALGYACAYMNRRERSVAEVRAQLERKGIADTQIERCLEELLAQGLLDDERFARIFVSDKRELEEWGVDRIRRGLQARGIARESIAAALSGSGAYADGEDQPETELDRALALLRRRFPEPPRDRRDRDRALGVLLRKGYESELALDALTAYARDRISGSESEGSTPVRPYSW